MDDYLLVVSPNYEYGSTNGEANSFDFYRFADGQEWHLGHATLNLAGDTYIGQFDTKLIMFDDREDLTRILCKRGIDKRTIRFASIRMVKALIDNGIWDTNFSE